MKFSLSILSFMDCAFRVVSKRSSPYPRSSEFSPLWFSSLIVSHFAFRFMIHHFELVFVKGARSVSGLIFCFSSVQFSRSVVSDSLWPHESQHARPPCPSPIPGVHPDSRPSSQWCHPAISSSVVPIFSCPNPSRHQNLFQWINSSNEVAKVMEFQL